MTTTKTTTTSARTAASPQPHQNQQRLYSFWSIVVIAANTMNGPGLTTLPSIASSAGQVLFCLFVVVAAISTSFVVQKLCDVMWRTHKDEIHHGGNDGGGGRPRLDESDIVALCDELFSQKKLASLTMIGCALSLALAQMMLCAAIADSMIVASTGQSCGYGPTTFQMYCTSNMSMKPFFDSGESVSTSDSAPVSLISMGLMIASSITISLAVVDLDSMLTAQYVLFGCLLLACTRFCYTLHNMSQGLLLLQQQQQQQDDEEERSTSTSSIIPSPFWVGSRPFNAVGPVLFNFAFVVTAPPLSCGAKSQSVATRALAVACVIMGVLYISVGYIGAMAATNTPQGVDDNLLSLVLRGTDPDSLQPLDMWSVVLFGLSQLAAIPVYCELARETLLTHLQMQNKQIAFVVSHVLPWTVVALTYNSELFEAFVDWSSLLLLGFANFSLPLLLHHKYSVVDDEIHHRTSSHTGPNTVVWALALITASIAAVIVQHASPLLAELTFLCTCWGVVYYNLQLRKNHDEEHHPSSRLNESSSTLELT
jgi:hypothetical protein